MATPSADAWLVPGTPGTGLIELTSGSKNVTGSGTNFDPQVTAGGYIYVSKDADTPMVALKVDTVTDDTHLVLLDNAPFSALGIGFNAGLVNMPVTVDPADSEDGHTYILAPGATAPFKLLVPGPATIEAKVADKFITTTTPTPPSPPDIYTEPAWMTPDAEDPLTVTGVDGVVYVLASNTGGAHAGTCYVPPLAIVPALAAGWTLV